MMFSFKKVNFIISLLLIIIIIMLNGCDSSKLQPQQHQQQSNTQQQQHQHNFDEINKQNNDNAIKYEAPDDCHYQILDSNSISLICSLRTINSVYDTTNFSVIQNDNTVSLRIYCNDSIFIQSSLEPKSFIHLNRLRELSIDYCKIKFLSHSVLFGLMDLRNLTLRTENNLWPSFNLDIESNAFGHAKNLERLDLSYNNIWQLPENLFCPLTNLNMLNLSVNHLQDINELSFRELLKMKQEIKNQQNQTILSPTYSTIFSSIGSTSIGTGASTPALASVGTTATTTTTTKGTAGSAIPTISNSNGLPSTSSSSVYAHSPQSHITALKNACLLDIEILDLSYNYFLLLPSYGFGLLKRLRQLRLHQNEISMIDDKALYNLKQLQILDLSSNKLVALPAELFTDTRESIQEIHLQNNSISVLSPILFSNLQQLQVLDLSSNHITSTWFMNTTFAGLIRLVLLNLSFNRITTVQPEIFSDLYTLQILNLRFNQIETITSDTFASMNNLHTLLLSNNKIKYLNAYSLNGLYGLSLLALDTNLIFGIHAEAFRNCSALQELNLSGNRLTEVPLAIKAMQRLRTIDLGENQIEQLVDPNQFSGMLKLYGLRLISNRIRNITSNIFKHLESLQILNLAHNQIDRIESGAFEQTAKIQAIRLDGNRLHSMDGLFSKMKELLWLNVSDNHLDTFDLSQIPPQLQWLDIHKNSIQEMTNYFALENHMQLQTLDASFNKIQLITPNIIPNSIELLFLNDNYIRTIESHTFMNKTNLTRVDLYANYIETLDPKALRLRPNKLKRQLPEFYIGGNPFICDCNIDWLQKINSVSTRQYPKIMDLETIYCKLLNNRDRSYITLIDADPVNFLCAYKTHCFALCHCCEFDACDCEMTCPQNCTCYHDGLWKTNVVECSNAGYSDMPGNIPMDATELYIDGNNLRLNIHGFIGRKNLKVIFANNSAINEIYNQTFIGLRKLKILHLEDNQLSKFQGYEFQSMENLRELYLQNNRLYFINNLTFIDLKKLEVIRLDNNKLMHFEIWQLSMNPYLVEIGIANNLWSCECEFLHQFRNYLQINQQKILDSTSISCIYNNLTNILKQDKNGIKCTAYKDLGLMSGNNNIGMSGGNGGRGSSTSGNFGRGISDLSYGGNGGGDGDDQRYYGEHNILNGNNVGLTTYVRPQDMDNLLPLLLIATCGFVGVFVIMLMTFCYRRELKLWVHTHCLPIICYRSSGSSSASQFIDEYDKDRLFDAYITYSLQDEHFINQILVNTLENDVGYRLCLHYRDFHVNTYVADTIIEAVESSKRAIIVLSRNFLYNEWSQFEVKNAIHEVIKRRRKFIFILYGELPQRDIDADMRLYLKTNTCIEWDDKKFWQKLRLALPHLRTASTIVPVPRPLGSTVRSSTAMHFLNNNKRLIGPTQGPPINSNSAVNIYATAQYQTGGPTAGNIPGTLRRSNIDGISTASSLVRHSNNNHNIIVDCTNNYATINDCLNNCSDKYDKININKFTLTNEKCRSPAPPPPPPPPPQSSNNFNNNMNNSNYQLSKTLDRYQHHEYAEPTNCIKETFPNYNNLNNLNNNRSICTTNTPIATTTTDSSSSRKCNTMGGHTHAGHHHGPPPSATSNFNYNNNNNNINNSSNINNINNHHVLNNTNLSSCSSVDNDSNYSVDSADGCEDGLDGACSSSNNGGSNKCYSYRNINNCSNTSSNCAAMIADGGLVSNSGHSHGITTNNINNLNNLNNNNIDDTPLDSDDNYECDVDFNQRNCKLNCTTISGSGNINNNNNNSNAAINNSNIINNNTIHNSISNNNNNSTTATTNSDVNCIDRRLPQAMWA